jgi:hypothetical protein
MQKDWGREWQTKNHIERKREIERERERERERKEYVRVKKKRKGCIYTRERENLVFKRERKCVWEIEVKYERVRENVCKRYSLCERECVCVWRKESCFKERELC